MAFKTVVDLDADTVVSIGGRDKKTGKANPTSVEGYFIGSKDVASKFSKTGLAKFHIFQTSKGNVGVFGKTDLDRKLAAVTPGTMVRVSAAGSVPTNKGNDMLKFKVEIDDENSIEVSAANSSEASDNSDDTTDYSADSEDDTAEEYEAPAASPATALSAAERKAQVEAMLAKNKRK